MNSIEGTMKDRICDRKKKLLYILRRRHAKMKASAFIDCAGSFGFSYLRAITLSRAIDRLSAIGATAGLDHRKIISEMGWDRRHRCFVFLRRFFRVDRLIECKDFGGLAAMKNRDRRSVCEGPSASSFYFCEDPSESID